MFWTWKKKWNALEHFIEMRKTRAETNINIIDLEIAMHKLGCGIDSTPQKPWPIDIRTEDSDG